MASRCASFAPPDQSRESGTASRRPQDNSDGYRNIVVLPAVLTFNDYVSARSHNPYSHFVSMNLMSAI